MSTHKLLQILSDGAFHSGESLGQSLSVTRAAIWKQIKKLDQKGVDIQSVRGKGYRLARPIELFNVEDIRNNIGNYLLPDIASIDIFPEIDSTSEYLKRTYLNQDDVATHVCLAECQNTGRGRRGRPWVSPYGTNIYCSIYRVIHRAPGDLGGLSLAIGIAVIRALKAVGINRAGLKWPNDIYLDGNKLAGVLIDLVGEMEGPSQIVAGIGLNIRMPDKASQEIDQDWADLRLYDDVFSRNQLTGELIASVLTIIDQYEQEGFAPFILEWQENDVFSGQQVSLISDNDEIEGTVCGIDNQGAIKLNTKGIITSYHVGEISLREK